MPFDWECQGTLLSKWKKKSNSNSSGIISQGTKQRNAQNWEKF